MEDVNSERLQTASSGIELYAPRPIGRPMKTRFLLIVALVVALTLVVFFAAPVVSVSGRGITCSNDSPNLAFNGCQVVVMSTYESPSCATLGFGVGCPVFGPIGRA